MTETFHNRMAMFLWAFAAAWAGGVVAMTYVAVRDGPPTDTPEWLFLLIMAAFWLVACGLVGYVCTHPCMSAIVVRGREVRATWRYPHRVVRKSVPVAAATRAALVETVDSEGSPYFHARVPIDGKALDIAEGQRRRPCEYACERFNGALR